MARFYKGENALATKLMGFAPTERLVTVIEQYAQKYELSKSEVIRRAIEAGLEMANWSD